jgi:low temperature requirement protein LtrA
MIRSILIFSPAILVLVGSLICLVLGCVGLSHVQKTKRQLFLAGRTTTLMIAGCIGLAGAAMIFALSVNLGPSKYASALLWMMVSVGCVLTLSGEYSVSRNIRLNTRNLFAPWVIVFGCLLIFLPLPVVLDLHEPFTFVYVCTVLLGIPVGQLALIKFWMNRKRQELASVDEQIEKIR